MVMSARNEMAREFYRMVFFDPANAEQALGCLEMMEFEGKPQMIELLRRRRGALVPAAENKGLTLRAGSDAAGMV